MKPKRSTEVQTYTHGVEHLAEETQVLWRILQSYHLTSEWTLLCQSKLRELVVMLFSQGLWAYTHQNVLDAILMGLYELQDSGYIGCYQDEQARHHIRIVKGYVVIDECSESNLVKNLVSRFERGYFVLDSQGRAAIGQCLRDGGYDWENLDQLNNSIIAMCSHPCNLIETFEHTGGVVLARLTDKVHNLYAKHCEPRVPEAAPQPTPTRLDPGCVWPRAA